LPDGIRLKAPEPIKVRGVILGGDRPAVCAPILGPTMDRMKASAEEALGEGVDMLELRIDSLSAVDESEIRDLVHGIRDMGEAPIIITNRPKYEGGFKEQDEEDRIRMLVEATSIDGIDLIDVELSTKPKARDLIIDSAKKHGVYVIISYHNFKFTPDKEELLKIVDEEERSGADVIKFVTMPNTHKDVLTQLQALLESRGKVKRPIISASMGSLGAYSRIVGLLLGSDLVYASLPGQPSAPGQLTIREVRTVLNILNPEE